MNKKGITATSLVFYIIGLMTIIGIIGTISIYMSNNLGMMKEESEGLYNVSKVERLITSLLEQKYDYEILTSTNPSYNKFQKIRFYKAKENEIVEHTLSFRISDENRVKLNQNSSDTPLQDKTGYIFLDDIVIAQDVLEFKISEIENPSYALGKLLDVNIGILRKDEKINYNNYYGVLYNGNHTQ